MRGEVCTAGWGRQMSQLEAQKLLLQAHFGALSIFTPGFKNTTPRCFSICLPPCNNYAALRDLGLQTKERICSLRLLSTTPTAVSFHGNDPL